ncbi:uncharacterized protein LOC129758576 [Uranotaenia lowii]|uniref:uncharacterized protein LOC129758576 n=1 Tax=Uranotaenia lowii TaxID=190385 RepID=UPI0024784A0B|nr:uncharacterized protein LOC129758576 [Uranotaenia lowii]
MAKGIVAAELPSLEVQFTAYAKYRPAQNTLQGDGKRILLSQSDAWMQQAKLMEKKVFTLTETGVAFFSFRKSTLDFEEFEQYLDKLCAERGLDVDEIRFCLVSCGPPGMGS